MSDSARRSPAPEPPAADLAGAVRRCRSRGEFLAALRRLYEEVDRRLAGGAKCLGGGGCCKFDLAGHRLYLTAGELALLADSPPPPPRGGPAPEGGSIRSKAPDKPLRELRCPYQHRGRCSAYPRRPLGCRVYFCRAAARGGPPAAYEEFHRKLIELHERFALPYLYVELTAALRQVLR